MQQYIGLKNINARPMTRGEYNTYRGWEVPADGDPADLGYLIEYPDSPNANHPGHEHFISWSPASVFEGAYKPVKALSFSEALHLVKTGMRVARKGWNGKGMFIFLVSGSTFRVSRPPLLGIYPEGTEINYHGHIDMRTADGTIVPWLASQTDMLADDWMLV